jgi:hypothetical protein
MMPVPFVARLEPWLVLCNKLTNADSSALFAPNLPLSISELTLSSTADPVHHEDANRSAAGRLSKENNGEGRAERAGSADGITAARKQGAAARG